MFLELRECKARSNSVSEGSKYLLPPTSWQMTIVIFRVWLYGVVGKEMIFG